jgi:hypothetical protein
MLEADAWQLVRSYVTQPIVLQYMSRVNPQLVGPELSWLVEVKVLQGRFGAADIYIPSLHLIIQVDGHHHDHFKQLETDSLFDQQACLQGYALLRLHHDDRGTWYAAIASVAAKCMAGVGHGCAFYSVTHPQKDKPTVSCNVV